MTCRQILKQALIILLMCIATAANAKRKAADAYRTYIDTYAQLAVAEQLKHGIPASITLAQGLLESAAGRSLLATKGNNHFGIKCHAGWTGATMLRNDDAPDECFRVYESVEESFADHSSFLLKPRYSSLFRIPMEDYVAWARTLRKCGYATDPNYADRLIAIIERYSLYIFDTGVIEQIEATATFIVEHLKNTHPIRKSRKLHYIVAYPGDTYTSLAKETGLTVKELLRYNDADDPDKEIKPWEEVYLQEKHATPPENVRKVTIGEGETIHSVSQRYGIRIDVIRKLNPKAKDRPGTLLRLSPLASRLTPKN